MLAGCTSKLYGIQDLAASGTPGAAAQSVHPTVAASKKSSSATRPGDRAMATEDSETESEAIPGNHLQVYLSD